MKKQIIQLSSYKSLLKDVTAVMSGGLVAAQRALEYQRVKTYWLIGQTIQNAVEASGGQLQSSPALYDQISLDLQSATGIDVSGDTVRRMVQFHSHYPIFPKNTKLTFTHYLALLRVEDSKLRNRLENKAQTKGLSALLLKEEIDRINIAPVKDVDENLNLNDERGEPYIYSARTYTDLSGKEEVCVDCGFKIHVPFESGIIKESPGFTPDKSRYVSVTKSKGIYHVILTTRKRSALYTYAAKVTKVVDGDTLDALIDVGFGIRTLQRFRLSAINAPEMPTIAGKKAKAFLTEAIAQCPIIVVRTEKSGMYGRWLADVYLLPGCDDPKKIAQEGQYLNQTMLDLGLAVKY